jgi:hypothetical protein
MIKTGLMTLALSFAVSPLAAVTTTVSKPAPIILADGGEIVSDLTVAHIAGNITQWTLTLNGLSHTYPEDLVFGLVNRTTGLGLMFLSGVGGSNNVVDTTLTFSDAATSLMPESFVGGGIESGTYLPSNYSQSEFTPDSGFSNAAGFSDFLGTSANGVWALYLDDIFTTDTGNVAGGWSLNFTTDTTVGGIPEPITWSLMIVGFGFTGATLRRRRHTTATFAA